MGCPPHQEQRRSVTSPPGPGPSSSTPARPHAGRGGDSHRGVGSGRAVDAAGSGQSGTSPRGPEKSGRDRRASVPRHVGSAVTAVVTAHGVKRSRPAGPGAARGPTRRGVPARRGRPDNALRKEKPAACRNQSKRNNGWGRGVARDAATGLESDGEGNATMDNCGIARWPSKCVQQRSTLHDVTVKARETPKGTGNLHEQEAAASSPCRVVGSGPASSAGEWSRPGPATAAAPTGIRVSTPHLPV